MTESIAPGNTVALLWQVMMTLTLSTAWLTLSLLTH
jgi:hypothetical protein